MDGPKSLSHKEWRRIAKKERRRKIRRKHAREREADDDRLRETLERSAEYLKWVQDQENFEKEKERREKEEHDEQERLWLEREITAQNVWKDLQEKRQKARAAQLLQEDLLRKEFEEKQNLLNKKKEELKTLQETQQKHEETLQKEIESYIEEGTKTPESLRAIMDSKPGKELCPFFSKTSACRYGDSCSRNHRRHSLGRVLIIPGFYTHFSLERNSFEYDTDVSLEFDNYETQKDFREFYRDVLPELESFGRIKTLRICRNTEVHLRGNLYVEYYSEREAARAWRRLNGRFYAGRQLNCEFANISSWRAAVCGLGKCPKGTLCNFLHTFRNPRDEYDIQSPVRWARKGEGENSSRRSENRSQSSWEESSRSTRSTKRDWRWSESPETEVKSRRSRSSSRSSKSRRKSPRSSSRSRKRRRSPPDDEYPRKSRESRRESNKENGKERKSKKHKKSSKKSKKSKWDKPEVSIRSDTTCSSPEDENLKKKRGGYQWDTTDSESESSKSPKD